MGRLGAGAGQEGLERGGPGRLGYRGPDGVAHQGGVPPLSLGSVFQDSLVYVLNRDRHTVGHRTPSSKPSISLSAPDILPLHCTIRRRQPAGREPAGARLVLEPIPGAPVSVNFSEVGGRTVALRHGDLLSLGLYYLLLFKDPVQAQPLPTQALARLRVVPQSCRLCGAVLRAQGTSSSARAAPPRPRQLHLEFEPDVEDALLQRIMTLVEPGGDDHKLTPAFLLCLCIQHSATRLEPGSFGQLLLKIARMIRETVWVRAGAGAVCCSLGGGGSRGRLGSPPPLRGQPSPPVRACPPARPAEAGPLSGVPAPGGAGRGLMSSGPVSVPMAPVGLGAMPSTANTPLQRPSWLVGGAQGQSTLC